MQTLTTIKTKSQLSELIAYLEDKDYVAFDTETTGIEKDSKIIGISVCAEETKAFYVITAYWDVKTQSLITLSMDSLVNDLVKCLFSKKLIGHNAIFDCKMIYNNYDIDLMPSVHTDTLILGQLLNENRRNGLKELGTTLFGEDAKKEQLEMKESIKANGGSLTKKLYELYKGDADLIAKYGAKDALLTYKLFLVFVEDLYAQGLEDFFYKDESMPLLRGPTYDLNTTGLRFDAGKLTLLKQELEAECLELKAFIYKEIEPLVKEWYPATNKKNVFNIKSNQQIAWLLFMIMGLEFGRLTDAGKKVCDKLGIKLPYDKKGKTAFIEACTANGIVFYKYTCVDKEFLAKISKRYKWVDALLKYSKNMKMLTTYVGGIESRAKYGIISPSFLQHGTTSGRYSSRDPNFQNLPRDDKRIKSCIIARPGKVFVGADYSQLEPRVFASVSQDPTLMECFAKGEDFYSVVGAPIFGITGCSMVKDDENSFANKHKDLRNIAKAFALATPYGTSAFQQSVKLGKHRDECQTIIDKYFAAYPRVELMMLDSHQQAKDNGVVHSLYGRPRRIPEAKNITAIYKNTSHSELPYSARTLLNLGMNHRVQSSAASIVNRASIALWEALKATGIDAKIVLQVHDEVIVECNQEDSDMVSDLLKHCMENTTKLIGVDLKAEPVVASNLGDLK